jgi:hypothetical protein
MIVFRRPGVTRKVFEKVREYQPRLLYVIADGPRPNVPGDVSAVSETRKIFEEVDWDCNVVRIFADENLGLRNRVMSGLDEVFSHEQSALILEDDCLPSEDFFSFSHEMLDRYSEHEQVALVSGNNFAPSKKLETSYYFSSHANIWGWATWARVWHGFRLEREPAGWSEEDIKRISERIHGRLKRKEFSSLLRAARNLDSWAIGFAAFCYDRDLLSVVPRANLVTNVGFGAESTHTKFESYADEIPLGKLSFPLQHPSEIKVDNAELRRESFLKGFRWVWFPVRHPLNFLGRVIRYLRVR